MVRAQSRDFGIAKNDFRLYVSIMLQQFDTQFILECIGIFKE